MNTRITRKFVLLIAFLLSVNLIYAKKIARLPEVLKPLRMEVDKNQLYINEENVIHIYSIAEVKWLKKFGKKGEGPGEFKRSPLLKSYPGYLLLNCAEKIMFYTHDGKFTKELRGIGHNARILPIGENYVGRENKFNRKDGKATQVIGIYDSKLKLLGEIYQGVMPDMFVATKNIRGKYTYEMLNEFLSYETYKGKIYIADSTRGIFVSVFNSKGEKLYEILEQHELIKVTDTFKKKEIEKITKLPWMRDIKNRYEFVFRKYFPAIRYFSVSGDNIYISTYLQKNSKQELIIMDLKGNNLRKVFVPLVNYEFDTPLYSIANEKYYYLYENELSDEWELHMVELKK